MRHHTTTTNRIFFSVAAAFVVVVAVVAGQSFDPTGEPTFSPNTGGGSGGSGAGHDMLEQMVDQEDRKTIMKYYSSYSRMPSKAASPAPACPEEFQKLGALNMAVYKAAKAMDNATVFELYGKYFGPRFNYNVVMSSSFMPTKKSTTTSRWTSENTTCLSRWWTKARFTYTNSRMCDMTGMYNTGSATGSSSSSIPACVPLGGYMPCTILKRYLSMTVAGYQMKSNRSLKYCFTSNGQTQSTTTRAPQTWPPTPTPPSDGGGGSASADHDMLVEMTDREDKKTVTRYYSSYTNMPTTPKSPAPACPEQFQKRGALRTAMYSAGRALDNATVFELYGKYFGPRFNYNVVMSSSFMPTKKSTTTSRWTSENTTCLSRWWTKARFTYTSSRMCDITGLYNAGGANGGAGGTTPGSSSSSSSSIPSCVPLGEYMPCVILRRYLAYSVAAYQMKTNRSLKYCFTSNGQAPTPAPPTGGSSSQTAAIVYSYFKTNILARYKLPTTTGAMPPPYCPENMQTMASLKAVYNQQLAQISDSDSILWYSANGASYGNFTRNFRMYDRKTRKYNVYWTPNVTTRCFQQWWAKVKDQVDARQCTNSDGTYSGELDPVPSCVPFGKYAPCIMAKRQLATMLAIQCIKSAMGSYCTRVYNNVYAQHDAMQGLLKTRFYYYFPAHAASPAPYCPKPLQDPANAQRFIEYQMNQMSDIESIRYFAGNLSHTKYFGYFKNMCPANSGYRFMWTPKNTSCLIEYYKKHVAGGKVNVDECPEYTRPSSPYPTRPRPGSPTTTAVPRDPSVPECVPFGAATKCILARRDLARIVVGRWMQYGESLGGDPLTGTPYAQKMRHGTTAGGSDGPISGQLSIKPTIYTWCFSNVTMMEKYLMAPGVTIPPPRTDTPMPTNWLAPTGAPQSTTTRPPRTTEAPRTTETKPQQTTATRPPRTTETETSRATRPVESTRPPQTTESQTTRVTRPVESTRPPQTTESQTTRVTRPVESTRPPQTTETETSRATRPVESTRPPQTTESLTTRATTQPQETTTPAPPTTALTPAPPTNPPPPTPVPAAWETPAPTMPPTSVIATIKDSSKFSEAAFVADLSATLGVASDTIQLKRINATSVEVIFTGAAAPENVKAFASMNQTALDALDLSGVRAAPGEVAPPPEKKKLGTYAAIACGGIAFLAACAFYYAKYKRREQAGGYDEEDGGGESGGSGSGGNHRLNKAFVAEFDEEVFLGAGAGAVAVGAGRGGGGGGAMEMTSRSSRSSTSLSRGQTSPRASSSRLTEGSPSSTTSSPRSSRRSGGRSARRGV